MSEELYQEWLDTGGGPDYSYTSFLEERIAALSQSQDLHGHIICVRPSDLGDYLDADDLQYVTEDMLVDIAETVVNSDSEQWDALFNEHLEATMIDNASHWQAMIDAEKARRAGL